jgi:hypothetical protein
MSIFAPLKLASAAGKRHKYRVITALKKLPDYNDMAAVCKQSQ